MRWLLPLVGVLTSGCYLSHRLPNDGGPGADAGCAPPPREPVTIEIEILNADPPDCARVGATYELETDLSGGPLYASCPDSSSRVTADGCGVEVEALCLGVEYHRELRGVLRGGRGRVEAEMMVGYLFEPCHREERWRLVE